MKELVSAKIVLSEQGMFYEFTKEDGTTFGIEEIDDQFLINILKQKGYKVTKEF